MSKAFYISTPIYYVNDIPHIGHAYTSVAADVAARYKRLSGEKVFFLTGTDEHGQKVEKAAKAKGETPIQLANRVVNHFIDLCKKLNISNDDFIRTSQDRHKKVVQTLFKTIEEKGDIYLSEYEDWYCTPCENFLTEKQLVNNKCPDCKRDVEKLKEESYFFRMSAYEERLLKHIEDNPEFIQPVSKRNEVISFVKEGLRDLSISRTTFKWGIPVPNNESHVIYVWFDALSNYLTAAGCYIDEEQFNDRWPANIHLIGKDILRFHAIYWPTILMAAGLPLPEKVFAHGWWTVNGEKMSKSLGNVIDPFQMADEYGVDQFRYFLLREVPFGLDGDFSETSMVRRINSDLANDLGNLLNRSISMAGKYFDSVVPVPSNMTLEDKKIVQITKDALTGYKESLDSLSFNKALDSIWDVIRGTNRFIDHSAPWKAFKDGDETRLKTLIYIYLESLRHISVMLYPFMPDSSKKMWEQLGIIDDNQLLNLKSLESWGQLKPETVLLKGKLLFPKIDTAKQKKGEQQKTMEENDKVLENYISIDDFSKVELKSGIIREASRVPKSNKLIKTRVDLGDESRQVIAGIGKQYEPDDLIGKQVVVVTNLKPVKLMGLESQGMILAAGSNNSLNLLTIDDAIEPGTVIR